MLLLLLISCLRMLLIYSCKMLLLLMKSYQAYSHNLGNKSITWSSLECIVFGRDPSILGSTMQEQKLNFLRWVVFEWNSKCMEIDVVVFLSLLTLVFLVLLKSATSQQIANDTRIIGYFGHVVNSLSRLGNGVYTC